MRRGVRFPQWRLLLLSQLDVTGFETLLRQWISAQPGVAEGRETLVCDGKTLRGFIAQTDSGAARFIAQVSLSDL